MGEDVKKGRWGKEVRLCLCLCVLVVFGESKVPV